MLVGAVFVVFFFLADDVLLIMRFGEISLVLYFGGLERHLVFLKNLAIC